MGEARLTEFNKIALVGKLGSSSVASYILKLAQYLKSQGRKVFIDCAGDGSLFSKSDYVCGQLDNWLDDLDLVIAVGGDGTLLAIARAIIDSSISVIGVNQGKLGFMTDIPSQEMIELIEQVIIKKSFICEKRTLIYAEVYRDDKSVYSSVALNDVVISRGAIGNMIEFDISIDSQFVLSQKSDGIIFSTPTGSTAYSLAAGGPILHPKADVFSIIPICPQSLTDRPLVISDSSTIEFVLARENSTKIHFDGQACFDLQLNDRVLLRKYPSLLKLVHPLAYNYYRTLRKKLAWAKRVS